MKNGENNPVVTLTLGGHEWTLRLGHKALQAFTARTRASMSRFVETLDRYDNLVLLLHCMLLTQDSTVSREQLDDWLDDADISEVFTKVGEAAEAAFPSQEEDGDNGENPPTAAGTGGTA